jgi:hypothetical protein
VENRSEHEVHEDRPGWRTSTELMYWMYGMSILQEHKIGDAAIAGKVHF